MDKLFNYIEYFVTRKGISDVHSQFQFRGLDEKHASIVFNMWLTLDYVTPHGKTFIEHFLREKSKGLSKEEVDILKGLNKSFVSLFKVLDTKNDYIILKDLINNKEFILLNHQYIKIKRGYVFLGRNANLLGKFELVGEMTFVDPKVEETILEVINRSYSIFKNHEPNLTMKIFLKKYSNLIYELIDPILQENIQEEIPQDIKNKLNEFGRHLEFNERLKNQTIRKHLDRVFEFYWYYLRDIDKGLYEIDGDVLKDFLTEGITNDFISSKTELASYITSIKKFAKYLKEKGIIQKEAYDSIVEISKNKDYYIEMFHEFDIGSYDNIVDFDEALDYFIDPCFNVDSQIARIVEKYNYDTTQRFLEDYKTFLEYLTNNDVKATNINNYINRKNILKLNDILENRIKIEGTVNQKDIPIIHLFYQFSKDKEILALNDRGYIVVEREEIEDFNGLNPNEQVATLINYIWYEANWNEFADESVFSGIDEEYQLRDEYLRILSRLKTDRFYDFSEIKMSYKEEDPHGFIPYKYPFGGAHVLNTKVVRYFSYIGLLEIQYKKVNSKYDRIYGEDIDKIKITKLGRELFKYLYKNHQDNDNTNVINLSDYR